MSRSQLTREEVARIELGRTEIRPRLAWIMVVVFLATAALPACLQIGVAVMGRHKPTTPGASAGIHSLTTTPSPASSRQELPQAHGIQSLAGLAEFIPTARQLRDFEDRLNETSPVTRTLGPWVGWVIKGMLRGGDEQAYFGRDGWLFYRQSVDSVTGPGFLTAKWRQERLRTSAPSSVLPQPDPLRALTQFHRQLAERGVALVVIPTPGKETLYPEKLTPQWNRLTTAVQNSSFDMFRSELVKAGVIVFDPTPALVEMKQHSEEDVYLKTDTHWTPMAMEAVARQLANWLRDQGFAPPSGTVNCRTRKRTVCSTGDIAAMLHLPSAQHFYPPETAQTTCVMTSDDEPWEADAGAPLLLMGDSFCNIYSLAEMGWGNSAGFAEHLSLALGQPVDRLVINAGGASSTRQELVRQIASGRDRLAGKRVVIYQFAARELAFGDWRLVDLPAAARPPGGAPSLGEELVVQGRVNAVARLPQPGSVPYKDCLLAIHVTQVRGPAPGALKQEVLLYALGMRDNRWLPIASVPAGASVQCRLRDWAQVEKQYGSYNRAELDDLEFLSLPTFWAEAVTW